MSRQRTEPTRRCKRCGKEFEVTRTPHIVNGKIKGYRKARQYFCSWECGHADRAKPKGRPKGEPRTPTPNTVCVRCGALFFKHNAHKRRSNKHYCSMDCAARARSEYMMGKQPPQFVGVAPSAETRKQSALRGDKKPAWKGGVTHRRRKGSYQSVKYVRCPAEYISMARKDGYVMEHRLIVAQRIGRPLLRSEVVHHINHNVTDNRDENLMLFESNAAHKRHEGETGYFKRYYATRRTRTNRQGD